MSSNLKWLSPELIDNIIGLKKEFKWIDKIHLDNFQELLSLWGREAYVTHIETGKNGILVRGKTRAKLGMYIDSRALDNTEVIGAALAWMMERNVLEPRYKAKIVNKLKEYYGHNTGNSSKSKVYKQKLQVESNT